LGKEWVNNEIKYEMKVTGSSGVALWMNNTFSPLGTFVMLQLFTHHQRELTGNGFRHEVINIVLLEMMWCLIFYFFIFAPIW
jgi:hypothetical protein